MADAHGLGPCGETLAGSTPVLGMKAEIIGHPLGGPAQLFRAGVAQWVPARGHAIGRQAGRELLPSPPTIMGV